MAQHRLRFGAVRRTVRPSVTPAACISKLGIHLDQPRSKDPLLNQRLHKALKWTLRKFDEVSRLWPAMDQHSTAGLLMSQQVRYQKVLVQVVVNAMAREALMDVMAVPPSITESQKQLMSQSCKLLPIVTHPTSMVPVTKRILLTCQLRK